MTLKRWARSITLITVLAMVVAACGDDNGGSEGGEGRLSGIDIAVGSKDFDEQLVLGQIMVQAFEMEGANVEDRVDLGGTQVARSALLSGEIDVYMEYNAPVGPSTSATRRRRATIPRS